MRHHQVADRVALHRIVVGHQVVQQYAEAVDIAGNRRLGARQQLGCRIDRCADDPPLRSAGVGAFLAGPEVHKNQPSALFAHDVLSLDVSMNETRAVNSSQGSTELVADNASLSGAERTMALEHSLESEAANEFHPETDTAIVFTSAVDRYDIRVVHARQCSRFVQQLRLEPLVGRELGPQKLDGHGTIELRVVSAIDGAE
jgi:hypothetical protein